MVICFCISFIIALFFIFVLGKKVNPIFINYLNGEVERITTNVVDSVLNDLLAKGSNDSLFVITRNDRNEVEMVDYNTEKVNSLLKNINQLIYLKLYNLEEGNTDKLLLSSSLLGNNYHFIDSGVVCEIPLGSLTGNGFLTNLGPIIPVKMSFLGQVSSNLKTRVTSYGINNLLLELYIQVEVKEKISLPKTSDVATVKVEAPLSIKIISGIVPNYYGGVIDKKSQTAFFSQT